MVRHVRLVIPMVSHDTSEMAAYRHARLMGEALLGPNFHFEVEVGPETPEEKDSRFPQPVPDLDWGFGP
jgi:hypothetical protein